MKKLIALFVILSLLHSCGGEDSHSDTKPSEENPTDTPSLTNNELNRYVYYSDSLNLSFSYPENWNVAEGSFVGILNISSPKTSKEDFQEMVNVVIGSTHDKQLDEFFADNLQTIQGMFVDLDQTEKPSYETINGNVFKKVRYNYIVGEYPLTAQIFVTIKGDRSYIINCSALQYTFDNYQKEFQSIVSSIEVK